MGFYYTNTVSFILINVGCQNSRQAAENHCGFVCVSLHVERVVRNVPLKHLLALPASDNYQHTVVSEVFVCCKCGSSTQIRQHSTASVQKLLEI